MSLTYSKRWWNALGNLPPGRTIASRDATPNNRFERSRGRVFGKPRSGSMIWINQLS